MSQEKKDLQLYIDEHLDRRRFAPKTKVSYSYWIYRLTDFFGKHSLHDFTLDDLSEFIRHLDEHENLAPSTIKQAANSLHFFFNTLGKQNWEIRRLRKKTIKRLPQYVPTQKEVFSIIEIISSKQSKLAVSLLYSMGLNLREIVNLRKIDIDFKNNIVHIPIKLQKGSRKAILAESLKPKLYGYIRNSKPTKWVFEKRDGVQITSSSIQKAVKMAVRKIGYQNNISVRSLRYAYIKHLEKLGENLQDILRELGMSHHTSYKFYSQLGQKKKKLSISPIDRRINEESIGVTTDQYIATNRINELVELESENFDLTKLIQLLHEINVSNSNQMLLSIPMQVRAIIDHVPSIFNCRNFQEVANNYRGSKSFKKSMQNLQNSLRNVADSYLHTQIRRSEVLPTANQVNFKADLDVLLSEIVRINK
ncbi:tyrosine-type recombinase/integrase [Candidatus Parcubacteria bacterium]|nr:tyrosine-type recombinase/integrase [Candidatus Parcubacteria bacterium]